MMTCDRHGIASSVADLVFPPACIVCGRLLRSIAPSPFCGECFTNIAFIAAPICDICGIPFDREGEGTHHCGACIIDPPPYSRARAVGVYKGALLEAIHLFKYRKDAGMGMGKQLGAFMAAWAYDSLSPADYDAVIPIPLHHNRLKERGFNQSAILAREIARMFSLPLDLSTLWRKEDRPPQVGLGRQQRRKNTRGVFEVKRGKDIYRKRLLLVDDVFTTGSTAGECARLLRRHGALEVAVLTLARA